MGAVLAKAEAGNLEPKQQNMAGAFYVETKLNDSPKWAVLEWHNLLRRNDMSMDQDNLDVATERFKDGEKTFHEGREHFYKIMTNKG